MIYRSIASGVMLLTLAIAVPGAAGISLPEIRALLDKGQLDGVIAKLTAEVDQNPAHESARILLAQTLERAGRLDRALETWRELLTLSRNDGNLHLARCAISRIRRVQSEMGGSAAAGKTRPLSDPFHIDMPPVDWEGLEIIEDRRYQPPVLPPPHAVDVPPFAHESEHFTVYSANERLSRVIAERAEIYLDFMVERLFRGRSWAVRFPILVYATIDDYEKHGGPSGSAGVTFRHTTGRTEAIILFQLTPDWAADGASGARRGRGIWKFGIESVLPHELTHAMINEFFGGQLVPQWLHEAVAERFEQTRDHYGEAARLARRVAAGEYFRIRELFDQVGYPTQISLFYEQSAAIALYLFETGPEAMHAFLTELRAGNGHDAACAAALGIDPGGAVEEFERRWVAWMKVRSVVDLDAEGTGTTRATRLNHPVFDPWVNELDTAASIRVWRSVALDAMNAFSPVAGSKMKWSTEAGALRCNLKRDDKPSMLGIRMNETPPVIVRCAVRFLGNPGDTRRRFGFVQLDADGRDTRVEITGTLRHNDSHEVITVWGDDLSVYIDGVCAGRFPAERTHGDMRDVDYPLAMIAYGPVEVRRLRIARIDRFSDKPVRPTRGRERGSSRRNRSGRRP